MLWEFLQSRSSLLGVGLVTARQVRFLTYLLKTIIKPSLSKHSYSTLLAFIYYSVVARDISIGSILGRSLVSEIQVRQYSHSLKIAVAILAALLSYVLRTESMQTEATFPRHASNLPRDKADVIVQGLIDLHSRISLTSITISPSQQ